jgi:hypothetical protein
MNLTISAWRHRGREITDANHGKTSTPLRAAGSPRHVGPNRRCNVAVAFAAICFRANRLKLRVHFPTLIITKPRSCGVCCSPQRRPTNARYY